MSILYQGEKTLVKFPICHYVVKNIIPFSPQLRIGSISEFSQNFQVIISFRQKRIKTNMMHSGALENHEIRISKFIKVYHEQLSYL